MLLLLGLFCFWCGGSNFGGVGRKEIKEGVGDGGGGV